MMPNSKTLFSQTHYEFATAQLRNCSVSSKVKNETAMFLCIMFERDNPKFNSQRFLEETFGDPERAMFKYSRRRWERHFTIGGVDVNGDYLDLDGSKRNISQFKKETDNV